MGALRAFFVTLILIALLSAVFFNLAQPPGEELIESTAPGDGGALGVETSNTSANETADRIANGTSDSNANVTENVNGTVEAGGNQTATAGASG